MNLAGKTITHSWSEGLWAGASFVTVFCSENELVWNNVTNPDEVTAERETYVRVDLSDDIAQISWRESPDTTNLGLIWTLNFATNQITGVIVNAMPEQNVNVAGTFTMTDGVQVDTALGLTGCS